MKRCYAEKLDSNGRIAIIDVVPRERLNSYYITRINVPEKYRRQGVASRLLEKVLEDADYEQADLYLEIMPSGDMGYWDLERWYIKNGFRCIDPESNLYMRAPTLR